MDMENSVEAGDAAARVKAFIDRLQRFAELVETEDSEENAVVDAASGIVEEFGAERVPEIRTKMPGVFRLMASALEEMEDVAGAEAVLDRLIAWFEPETDVQTETICNVVKAYLIKAKFRGEDGALDDALALCEKATDMARKLKGREARETLLRCRSVTAVLLYDANREDEAFDVYEEILKKNGAEKSDALKPMIVSAAYHRIKCLFLLESEDDKEVFAAVSEFLRKYKDDADINTRRFVAEMMVEKAMMLYCEDKHDEARKFAEVCVKRMTAEKSGDVALVYAVEIVRMLDDLMRNQPGDAALRILGAAIKVISASLLAGSVDDSGWQTPYVEKLLQIAWFVKAEVLFRLGRRGDAEFAVKSGLAVRALDPRVLGDVRNAFIRMSRAEIDMLLEAGKYADALAASEKLLAFLAESEEGSLYGRAAVLDAMAVAYEKTGDTASADEAHRKAEEVRQLQTERLEELYRASDASAETPEDVPGA